MMELIFKIIFFTVSWSLGWRVIVSEGMLLEKIGAWAEKKVDEGNKFYDVFICPFCIPNIHGLLFVWPLLFGLGIIPFVWDWKYLMMYPLCLCASSFLTGFLWSTYLLISHKTEYYRKVNSGTVSIEEINIEETLQTPVTRQRKNKVNG